jgi:hypothetical protein
VIIIGCGSLKICANVYTHSGGLPGTTIESFSWASPSEGDM